MRFVEAYIDHQNPGSSIKLVASYLIAVTGCILDSGGGLKFALRLEVVVVLMMMMMKLVGFGFT